MTNAISVDPIVLPNNISYKDLVDFFNSNNKDGIIDWGIYSIKSDWISIIESSYKFYKKVWLDYTYAKSLVENYGNDFELIKIEIKREFCKGYRYSRK